MMNTSSKKPMALDVLAEVSGISIEEARKIFAEVKDNHRKLGTCTFHEFTVDTTPEKPFNKRWMCIICGGTVGDTEKTWYEKGVEHVKEALK